MEIIVKRRLKDEYGPTEKIVMDFPNITDAIKWMEEENAKDERQYDIAAVSFS